jgi:hypothetical protein
MLSDILKSMLRDDRLEPIFLVLDALDECDGDSNQVALHPLLKFVSTASMINPKVKWLISSRPDIQNKLIAPEGSPASWVQLQLDVQDLQIPVKCFIDYKVKALGQQKSLDTDDLKNLTKKLYNGAGNTFLWVALICTALERVRAENFETILKLPKDLNELYESFMKRILDGEETDREPCCNVLMAATFSYRPLSLAEIEVASDLSIGEASEVVKLCSYFLLVRDNTVFQRHKSIRDYFVNTLSTTLKLDGAHAAHARIFSYSVQKMGMTLKSDILGMGRLDLSSTILESPPENTPGHVSDLRRIQYACTDWVNHLCDSIDLRPKMSVAPILDFLKSDFLHWLEALSLLAQFTVGVTSIRKLNGLVKVNQGPYAFL